MDQTDPIVIETSRFNFVIIGHRAKTSSDFSLNDLCGAAGRWDGLARCINTALLLSHEIRGDTSIHLILLGEVDPPKILSISGRDVKYLNPDERSTVALMKKPLALPLTPGLRRQLSPSPGLHICRGGLDEFLSGTQGSRFLLDEGGLDIHESPTRFHDLEGDIYFFLSDDRDLSHEERSRILSVADGTLSVGPKVLHAHQVVAIINNVLDRKVDR